MTVDVAPYRCPDPDARVLAAAKARFPAPPASKVAADGARGLDDDAVRAWLDRAEELDATRKAALVLQLDEYRRCKAAAAARATVVASAP